MADGQVVIQAKLDTTKFDKQIEQVRRDIADYENQLSHANEIGFSSRDVDELNVKLEKSKNKLIQLEKQKKKLEEKGTAGIVDELKQSSSQLTKIISKVGKWALAIFSVRTAYNLVRQASSTLSQYNEQYASDLEYIKYALAQAIAPALQYIVSLAYKLLGIISSVLNALFEINIFSKASASNFVKAKNSLSGASKSAKDLKKTLAGFDEMNVLSDTSSSSSGGVATPSMDLSSMGDITGFDNLTEIIANVMKLAGALVAVRTAIKLIGAGMGIVKAIGFGLVLFGIISLVDDLITYLQEGGNSFENFGKIITDIGFIIVGLGAIIGSLPLVIAGAIAAIVGYIVSNWETIKSYLDKAIEWFDTAIENVQNFFTSKLDFIKEHFGLVGVAIWKILEKIVTNALNIVKGIISTIKNLLDGLFTGIKGIFDGILQIFKGNFKQGIISIGKGIVNVLIGIINGAIEGINTILTPIRDLIVEAGKILGKGWTMNNIRIPTIPLLATGAIINQPGRGVPVGMAGERGREGLIPLDDNQAMETLGQAIGRYITINASIMNSMNGRVISRELQKIKNTENFAFNG